MTLPMASEKFDKQKKYTYIVIGIALFLLILTNGITWLYLNRLDNFLLDFTRNNMQNMVSVAGELLDGEDLLTIIPEDDTDPQKIYYSQILFEIKNKLNLQDIYIISPVRDILVEPAFTGGGIQQRYSIDDELWQNVIRGETISTPVYRLGDQFFLTSALPIFDHANNISAILIAEARADFFNILNQFYTSLWFFTAVNIILVLIAIVVVYYSVRRIIMLQTQIQNQQNLVRIGEMASSVAHEVRNPLGIIKATNDVIRKKYGSANDEFFNYIPAELDRLNQLINNFLSFSGDKKPQIQKFRLDDLLEKIKFGEFSESAIECKIETDPRITEISSDPKLMEQILLNLLKNSVQSIAENGSVKIFVRPVDKKYFEIRIRDNGSGIEKEILDKIFEPFFTTRESGSGLGLAITSKIVQQLHGKISVNSEPGIGTEVILVFPIASRI